MNNGVLSKCRKNIVKCSLNEIRMQWRASQVCFIYSWNTLMYEIPFRGKHSKLGQGKTAKLELLWRI